MADIQFSSDIVIKKHLDEILKRRMDSGHLRVDIGLEFSREIIASQVVLHQIDDNDQKRLVVNKALRRWRGYSTRDLAMFRRALSTERRLFLDRPSEDYAILLFLNCEARDLARRRSFSSLGQKLLIRSAEHVRRNYARKDLIRDVRHMFPMEFHHDLRSNFKFTQIIVKGAWSSEQEAVNEASRAFNFFRACLNLYRQYGSFLFSYGGRPKPLGELLPSPVYGIFDGEGEYRTAYISDQVPEYRARRLNSEQISQADRLMATLKAETDTSTTKALLIDVLLKYGDALDISSWTQAFLTLWQCLELATLQAPEGRQKTVVSRIRIMLKSDAYSPDLLDSLMRTRNELVHTGRFSQFGWRDVRFLKHITERVIGFFWANLLRLA